MYHHRRTFLVDRSFQLKYIVLLMAWGVVIAGLFGLWTYQAHQQAVDTVVHDPELRVLFAESDRQLVWALAGIGALSAAVLGLVGFVMTHRVAGPVYVMSHFLSLLADGRYPTRRGLRKRDELKHFHAQFLDAVEAMKERDAARIREFQDVIAAMRAALPGAPSLAPFVAVLEREVQDRREALAEASSPVSEAAADREREALPPA